MSIVWSILGFVIVMGLIVTIHEWGHYQVARWFNIKVVKFSIGFGKPIYSRQGKETEFVISQFPLGGYVKFADEREGLVEPQDLKRAFNRQSVYKRFAVVAAGPLVNLLFAWLVFTAMYMIGVSGLKPLTHSFKVDSPLYQSLQNSQEEFESDQAWSVSEIDGVAVYSWQMVHQQLLRSLAVDRKHIEILFTYPENNRQTYLTNVSLSTLDINNPDQGWLQQLGFVPTKPIVPAVLGQIIVDGPAMKAGLSVGDKVLTIDEKLVSNWQDFVKVVQANPQTQVNVEFERSGVIYHQSVSLGMSQLKSGDAVGVMGVGVLIDEELLETYSVTIAYGLFEALKQGYNRSEDLVVMSLTMLKRMLIGDVSTDNLSGPVSIAQFSGQALQTGLIAFLSLVGLLSLSIGILNLLPIPILDGGHLVYYLIEMIKGSPVGEQVMVVGQTLGLMIIIGLTFLALFNDLIRISHG